MIPLHPQDVKCFDCGTKRVISVYSEGACDRCEGGDVLYVDLVRLKEAIEGLRKDFISEVSMRTVHALTGEGKHLSLMQIMDIYEKFQDKWFGGVLK